MKKIGMVVAAAAVVSYAGAARAQTTEQIIEATATIQSVMSLEEIDGLFNCGTVSGFGTVSADCPDEATAVVRVTANQNWLLATEDVFLDDAADECSDIVEITAPTEAGADAVTLCNDDPGAEGWFVVALDYASSCAEAIIGTNDDTAAGTSAEECDVSIVTDDDASSISELDSHDGFGVYVGTFRVTLSPDA